MDKPRIFWSREHKAWHVHAGRVLYTFPSSAQPFDGPGSASFASAINWARNLGTILLRGNVEAIRRALDEGGERS